MIKPTTRNIVNMLIVSSSSSLTQIYLTKTTNNYGKISRKRLNIREEI